MAPDGPGPDPTVPGKCMAPDGPGPDPPPQLPRTGSDSNPQPPYSRLEYATTPR
jgi:hypothetical protein